MTWEENDSTEPKMNSENKTESEPNDTTNGTEKRLLTKKCGITGIYGFRCRTTGKWYIGQSFDINDRWEQYKKLKCRGQRKLYNALVKYGYDDFETCVIELCDEDIPQEILDKKETAWIKHFNSVDRGYNLRAGGSRGRHSNETKSKMSTSAMGRKLSDETKQKLVDAWTIRRTKPISLSTRQKISIANTGQTRTTQTKRKISESLNGKSKTDTHRKNLSEAVKLWWKIKKSSFSTH